MLKLLEQYGFKYDDPLSPPVYPGESDGLARVSQQLAPAGEPSQRRVNDRLIYSADGKLLGQANIAEWVASLANQSYQEKLEAACQLYQRALDEQLKKFRELYQEELDKKKGLQLSFNPAEAFEHFLDRHDKDYMLALAQYIYDMEAAKAGKGYHALTAELKIVLNYLRSGQQYLQPYPAPEADFATGRTTQAPDENIVLYASGYGSSWTDAAREAYTSAYKLGYPLSDIYIFNYRNKGPLCLGELMGRNARFVGDFKLFYEVENHLHADPDDFDMHTIFEELLAQSEKLRDWTFTIDDTLNTSLRANAIAMAQQVRQLKALYPGKRLNLIGSSQGGAILAGFLLQKDDDGLYLLDDELDRFVDKYALTLPAHGGAYLAQLSSIARQTGFVVNILQTFSREVQAQATLDMAIDSEYIQANYAALQDPQTRSRLARHRGVEVYAANDDLISSLPLAPLPGTVETRMIAGRHGEREAGIGEGTVAKANKYIHNVFCGVAGLDLESDKLIHAGYLKKGLPDFDILPSTGLIPDAIRREAVPFLTGRAGVVDYEVQQLVLADLEEEFTLKVPEHWPAPTFKPFIP